MGQSQRIRTQGIGEEQGRYARSDPRGQVCFQMIVVEAVADRQEPTGPINGAVGALPMAVKGALITVSELVQARRDDQPGRI